MPALPQPPSLPPGAWIDIRRECLKAAVATAGIANEAAAVVTAKVYEGYVIHGDLELAYRYAGCPDAADLIAATKAGGAAQSVPIRRPAGERRGAAAEGRVNMIGRDPVADPARCRG